MCDSHAALQSRLVMLIWTSVYVAARENAIINRLNKTKLVREVDHEQERVDRLKKEKAASREIAYLKVRLCLPFTGADT